jgi:hypothetical protein
MSAVAFGREIMQEGESLRRRRAGWQQVERGDERGQEKLDFNVGFQGWIFLG